MNTLVGKISVYLYFLDLVSAFISGGFSRHYHLSWPRRVVWRFRLDGQQLDGPTMQPKIRGRKRGLRSALIVVACVFSWDPVRLRRVQGVVGRSRLSISRNVLQHDWIREAFLGRAVSVGLLGTGCYCPRTPTSFRRQLEQALLSTMHVFLYPAR